MTFMMFQDHGRPGPASPPVTERAAGDVEAHIGPRQATASPFPGPTALPAHHRAAAVGTTG
jgi:hypothetical protein